MCTILYIIAKEPQRVQIRSQFLNPCSNRRCCVLKEWNWPVIRHPPGAPQDAVLGPYLFLSAAYGEACTLGLTSTGFP